METNPPNFWTLFKFRISAPINVPKTPEIKAVGAANSEVKIKAKIAEKIGGIKVGKETPPFPRKGGVILAKNLEIIIIKIVAIKIG